MSANASNVYFDIVFAGTHLHVARLKGSAC
jgi:hypothetical protein